MAVRVLITGQPPDLSQMLPLSKPHNLYQSKRHISISCLIHMISEKQIRKILCLEPKYACRREAGTWWNRGIPAIETKSVLQIPFCLHQAVAVEATISISSQPRGYKSRVGGVPPVEGAGASDCSICRRWGFPRGRDTGCSADPQSYFPSREGQGGFVKRLLFMAFSVHIGRKGS